MATRHASTISDAGMPFWREASVTAERTAAWQGVDVAIAGDLATIEAEWRAFEKIADGTAFQTFDWLATWQRHVGAEHGTRPAIVVGRDADGALLFIFALSVERKRGVRC